MKRMENSPQISRVGERRLELVPPQPFRRCRAEAARRLELDFLAQFNRDLEANARLTRLNEDYLGQKMAELDGHRTGFTECCEYTRARLHELLLICAANYANNCEFSALGDLMFNPRLTLIHIKGRPEPLVKERHTPLSEQLFKGRTGIPPGFVLWLKEKTELEIKEEPLIPHSYERLKMCRFVPRDYLTSARDRAVRIADLSAHLCRMGFEDRAELDEWLRKTGPEDRSFLESRLLPLDWELFKQWGSFARVPALPVGNGRCQEKRLHQDT